MKQESTARFSNRLPLWLERHSAKLQVTFVVVGVLAAGLLATLAKHDSTGDRIVTFASVVAATLLAIKMTGGQFNASMEVSVTTQRHPSTDADPAKNHLAVILTLKRGSVGRIRLEEVVFELSRLGTGSLKRTSIPSPIQFHGERTVQEALEPSNEESPVRLEGCCAEPRRVELGPSSLGIALPPGDATQLTYVFEVDSEAALHIDVTIIGKRTAAWLGYPQWRASGASFPLMMMGDGESPVRFPV